MTGPALRSARLDQLRMTQQALADCLDISVRNLRAFEVGEKDVPVVVEMAVERLVIKQEYGI
jgi:DNA-binding transcriptional regulator YiaG